MVLTAETSGLSVFKT